MVGRIDPATRRLTELKQAADSASEHQLLVVVEDALHANSSLVVEQAAILVRERELKIEPAILVKAYEKFLVTAEDADQSIEDKNCRAKLPLVEALHCLQFDDPDFYSAGLLYVQWEPAWPESQETAGNLRGAHAFALVSSQQASPHETLMQLVALLFDRSVTARTHAAAAIGQLGHPGSAAVMKTAILQNTDCSEVLGECFRSLLRNDRSSLNFIASYLEADELVIEAASTLTEFGSAAGVGLVIAKASLVSGELQEALFATLGISRHADSVKFLVESIGGKGDISKYAVKALAPKKFYPNIVRQLEAAVSAVDDKALWAVFDKVFGSDVKSD